MLCLTNMNRLGLLSPKKFCEYFSYYKLYNHFLNLYFYLWSSSCSSPIDIFSGGIVTHSSKFPLILPESSHYSHTWCFFGKTCNFLILQHYQQKIIVECYNLAIHHITKYESSTELDIRYSSVHPTYAMK